MNNSARSKKLCSPCRVLIVTAVILATLLGVLNYGLFGYKQVVESPYRVAQIPADVRTMVAAISYLLDPEPSEPVENPLYSLNFDAPTHAVTEIPFTKSPTSG